MSFTAVLNVVLVAVSVSLCITSRSLNCAWFLEKTVSMSCFTRSDWDPGTSNPPWERLSFSALTAGNIAMRRTIHDARTHRRRR